LKDALRCTIGANWWGDAQTGEEEDIRKERELHKHDQKSEGTTTEKEERMWRKGIGRKIALRPNPSIKFPNP